MDFCVDIQVVEMGIPYSLTQTQTQEEVLQVEVCFCFKEFTAVSFQVPAWSLIIFCWISAAVPLKLWKPQFLQKSEITYLLSAIIDDNLLQVLFIINF